MLKQIYLPVPSKIKNQILLARIEAYEEAAAHLELIWTNDKLEQQEGMKLCKKLRKEIQRIANRLTNPLP